MNGEGGYPEWLVSAPYAEMLPATVLAPGSAAAPVATAAGLARGLGAGAAGGEGAAGEADGAGGAGGAGAGAMVVAGTTDSVAAFVAARCTRPGDAVTSLVGPPSYRPFTSSNAIRSLVLCLDWRRMTWRAISGRP